MKSPHRVPSAALATALVIAALLVMGCSSVGGSAIRTGPVQMPAYSGPVAIYSSGQPPPGAVDLGVVEVHAAQQEATIDELMPQFVRRVAQIGGNVAVVDGVRARFEFVGRTHVETFYYTCGLGATCAGTRVYALNDELMIVSIFGRAFTTHTAASPANDPNGPLLPPSAPAPASPNSAPTPTPPPADAPPASSTPEPPAPSSTPNSGEKL